MSGGRGDGGNRKIAPVRGNREVSPAAQRPVRASGPGEGVWGNREVPPATKTGRGARGHLRAAWAEAIPEEGGSWGKTRSVSSAQGTSGGGLGEPGGSPSEHRGVPRGSEPKASDVHPAASRYTSIVRAATSGHLNEPARSRPRGTSSSRRSNARSMPAAIAAGSSGSTSSAAPP